MMRYSKSDDSKKDVFLQSAMSEKSLMSSVDFSKWFEERKTNTFFEINKKPLSELNGWIIEPDTGNVAHKTGRFFRIEGIEIKTNFGYKNHWAQPIINQPEIGILGFITKKINGILHFLVQAKMEPGNINLLQLSPTLQATKSNFTQAHGGKKPLYLDYFLDRKNTRVLIDQLQSEQGARFLRKRNRNIIIQINDDEKIETYEDFFWLTLAQIYDLLKIENLVNMDSRTVLSGIHYHADKNAYNELMEGMDDSGFHKSILLSALAEKKDNYYDTDSIINWFTDMKIRYELDTRSLPVNKLKDWVFDGNTIFHKDGKFFSVIGVSVSASTREVKTWDQPLIESAKGGVICFICQKINGVLHFLVQARVEPGNFDNVELAPTLQFTQLNYNSEDSGGLPPFYEVYKNIRQDQIKYDFLQSEEGGRFYHDQNRYLLIECDENQIKETPENYIWMTLRQAKEIIRFNNCFNIEARSLFACIGIGRATGMKTAGML